MSTNGINDGESQKSERIEIQYGWFDDLLLEDGSPLSDIVPELYIDPIEVDKVSREVFGTQETGTVKLSEAAMVILSEKLSPDPNAAIDPVAEQAAHYASEVFVVGDGLENDDEDDGLDVDLSPVSEASDTSTPEAETDAEAEAETGDGDDENSGGGDSDLNLDISEEDLRLLGDEVEDEAVESEEEPSSGPPPLPPRPPEGGDDNNEGEDNGDDDDAGEEPNLSEISPNIASAKVTDAAGKEHTVRLSAGHLWSFDEQWRLYRNGRLHSIKNGGELRMIEQNQENRMQWGWRKSVNGVNRAREIVSLPVRGFRSFSMSKRANSASRVGGTAALGTGTYIAAANAPGAQTVLANMYYGTGAGLVSSGLLPLAGPGAILAKRNFQSWRNGVKSKQEYDAILEDVFNGDKKEIDAFEKELVTDCRKHGDQLVDTEEEKYLAKAFHLSGLMQPDQCPYLAQMFHGGDLKYARHACTRMIALAHVCSNDDSPDSLNAALKRAAESLVVSIPKDKREVQITEIQKQLEEAYHKVQQGDGRFLESLKRNDLLGTDGVDDANNKSTRCKQFRETAVAYGRMVNTWHRERMEGTITATSIGPAAVAGWATLRWWTAVTGPSLAIYRYFRNRSLNKRSTLELDADDPTRVLRGKDNGDIVPRESRIQGDAITDLKLLGQAQEGEISATEDSIGKEGMQWYGEMKSKLWDEMANRARTTNYKDIRGFASACAAAMGSVITGHPQGEPTPMDPTERREKLAQLRKSMREVLASKATREQELSSQSSVSSELDAKTQQIEDRERLIRTQVIEDLGITDLQARVDTLSHRVQQLIEDGGDDIHNISLGGAKSDLQSAETKLEETREKINSETKTKIEADSKLKRWKKTEERLATEEGKHEKKTDRVKKNAVKKDSQVLVFQGEIDELQAEIDAIITPSIPEVLDNGALLAERAKDPAIRQAFALVVAQAWEEVKDNRDWRRVALENTGSVLYAGGKAVAQSPVAQKSALVASPLAGAWLLGSGPLGMAMATGATVVAGFIAVVSHVKRKKPPKS